MTSVFVDSIQAELIAVNDRIEQCFKIRPGHLTQFAHIPSEPMKRFYLPALTILAGKLFGKTDKRIIHLAAAVEMIFLASDIHFSIPDEQDMQKEDIDPRDGASLPVLVGDYLYAYYFLELCEGDILEILDPLSNIVAEMNSGALLKVKRGITVDDKTDFLAVVEKEAALLFRAAMTMAAQLAGAQVSDVDKMAVLGYNIGMAFGLIERGISKGDASEYLAHARQALLTLPGSSITKELSALIDKLETDQIHVSEKKLVDSTKYEEQQAQTYSNDYIDSIFSAIAGKYDVLNSVLSLNQDKYWRRFAAEQGNLRNGSYVLDACCGTGMQSFEIAKKVGKNGKVLGLDKNDDMLTVARTNLGKTTYRDNVKFVHGDVLDMPFSDNTFDCVVVGFGLRNIDDYKKAMSEMIRVLKPKHPLIILEFAKPTVPGFKQVYELYFNKWVPFLDKFKLGNGNPYKKLHDSWGKFPDQGKLLDIMKSMGLQQSNFFELTGGVIAVHIGYKSEELE